MSYDIYLNDPETNKTIELEEKHGIKGGTYAVGGSADAWLNVTYNYSEHFQTVLGEKGIRTIYGMTGKQSIPILLDAMEQLKDDTHPDYWKPTEGNAKAALHGLVLLADKAPHGIWQGD